MSSNPPANGTLRVRRLGRAPYDVARDLQEQARARAGEPWLLLVEHPHVYTLGVRARAEHVLVDPATVGADVVRADRGGDVTYHGPGQLVGYPIVDVALRHDAIPDHVHAVEAVVIGALRDLGVDGAGRRSGLPGIWIGDRKIAAVGVRVARGRSLHGFALNVAPDLAMFGHIVPCGIHGCSITSLAAEGCDASMDRVADAIVPHAASRWSSAGVDDRSVEAGALRAELELEPLGV
jgi:lipoyl synthase